MGTLTPNNKGGGDGEKQKKFSPLPLSEKINTSDSIDDAINEAFNPITNLLSFTLDEFFEKIDKSKNDNLRIIFIYENLKLFPESVRNYFLQKIWNKYPHIAFLLKTYFNNKLDKEQKEKTVQKKLDSITFGWQRWIKLSSLKLNFKKYLDKK